MKKLLGFALSMMLVIGISSTATAQEGAFTIGAGLAYGSEIGGDGEMGLDLHALYGVTNDIRVGAGFTYYLVDAPAGVDFSASELNLDGHYMFMNDSELAVYGLAGLSIGMVSVESGGISNSDSEIGINLGGGLEYNMGSIALFAEPKYTISGFEQFVVKGGVRFGL